MMQKSWNEGALLGVSSAYWRGCTLQAGVRLEIFTVLADQQLNADAVACLIDADPRGTTYLLDALCAMGLLQKEDGRYGNSPETRQLLCKDSPNYMGHIILHHHQILDGWAQLDVAVKTGAPVPKRSYGEKVERESFLMGMFNLAMALAPGIVEKIDLSGRSRLLDLGGGPGTYAIHFCLANPALHAVVYDRPTTRSIAVAAAKRFDMAERMTFIGGDITCDSIPGGPYDVAWLSHLLHSNGPEVCQQIIDKCVAAMEPGGLIMIHEFILDDNKDGPEFPALFSLNMLVNNPEGRAYSEGELTTMLQRSGVTDIRRLSFQGPSDSAILSGVV